MDAYLLAFLASAGVIILLFTQIKKITDKFDKEAYEQGLEPSSTDQNLPALASKYSVFCDSIDSEIRALRGLDESALKDVQKDKFLQRLSEVSRKLAYVQSMNINTKDKSKWESEIYAILMQIEGIVDEFCLNAEGIKDAIRERLKDKF